MIRVVGACAALACAVAMLLAPMTASAQPALALAGACGFAGTQFALSGSGFAPRERTVVEVMSTVDPLAGAPLSSTAATADGAGDLGVLLDVPATGASDRVVRSVRVRPNPDRSLGIPTLLAGAPWTTATRGVTIAPQAARGRGATIERWSMTGLLEGTRLWAHYRHGAKTVARVALGMAKDACGRLRFALRTLPRGHERPGTWDVWLTAKSAFRVPSKGVYVRRSMKVAGSGSEARVTFGSLRARLVPSDPRAVAPSSALVMADANSIGVIRTVFLGRAPGAAVDFFERIDDRLKPLGRVQGTLGVPAVLEEATTWSCSRRIRRFVASATLADGTVATGAATVRTPSCAKRFRISVPPRTALDGEVVVRVIDRWGNGAITPTLCLTPPKRERRCEPLVFPSAVTIATRRLRARTRGTWHVELRVAGRRMRTTFTVGAQAVARPRPLVLATGDSMMLGIDRFLADELAATARVRRDVRPGTGISKPTRDWLAIAAGQAADLRPRDTVMLIGAADGYVMITPEGLWVECCGEPWIAEYARRVQLMMHSYLQLGRGRVFWATLPLPRAEERLVVSRAVNLAVERAGAGVPGVHVVRLDLLFSPGGFSEVMRYRGASVVVRDEDAIHLNFRGQAIAAKLIAELIRRAR